MTNNEEEWLTPEDLAEWLRVPIATVYGWRTKATGPPGTKVGRHVRYRRSEVDAWLEAQTQRAEGQRLLKLAGRWVDAANNYEWNRLVAREVDKNEEDFAEWLRNLTEDPDVSEEEKAEALAMDEWLAGKERLAAREPTGPVYGPPRPHRRKQGGR